MTLPVLFDGVPNSRSLGGLPLKRGGETKDGVLYRSAALDDITREGEIQMEETPLGVVADLRTLFERAAQPDKVPHRPHRVKVVEIPIEAGNISPASFVTETLQAASKGETTAEALSDELPTLPEMYRIMVASSAKELAKVAGLVANVEPGEDNAVLVHCTAGKDRTGVSVALILDIAGVEREAIIENYAVSQQYLAGAWADKMLGTIEKFGVPLVPKLVAMVTTTPPDAIKAAFDWVEENFGSSENYLMSGGLQAAQIENVRLALE